jgi:hypothetical protein
MKESIRKEIDELCIAWVEEQQRYDEALKFIKKDEQSIHKYRFQNFVSTP